MRQATASSIFSFCAACVAALALSSCGGHSFVFGSPSGGYAPTAGQVQPPSDVDIHMTSNAPGRTEHLTTWVEVGGMFYNPPHDDWAKVAPFIDWAITIQGPKAAEMTTDLNSAGIHSVYYTDPNRQRTDGPEYTNDESTFAHDCSGNRILITKLPYLFYLMNPSSPDLYQLWINEINRVRDQWGGDPQYVFEDTADHINYVSAMPCDFWQPTWDASTNAMDVTFENSIKLPIIYNAGDIHLLDNVVGVSPAVDIDPTTAGGLTEACFGNGFALAVPLQFGQDWLATQTQLLRMQHDRRLAICHANSLNDAAKYVDQRMYVYASFLLTYDPQYSIFTELYSTPSKLTVFPEVYLVPHFAYQPIIHNIDQLEQAGGSYAQQYARCDFYGKPIRGCAFVVNPSRTKSVPFPFKGLYSATLVLKGYSVVDGGKARVDGPAPSAMIPPESAVVALGLTTKPPPATP
jgi:hypothetical protein